MWGITRLAYSNWWLLLYIPFCKAPLAYFWIGFWVRPSWIIIVVCCPSLAMPSFRITMLLDKHIGYVSASRKICFVGKRVSAYMLRSLV
ncbi:hypothetical protein DL89DRAFT_264624 [Linderina pennispora]|uniref:Uncharacterized protein n=1 Tax=Linderina pennispora TaxID=61395 RepID=A0A1Y1WNF0_9FUNG|nr:uncharacterized protein DL89DRAFT_264624 [Linderina pennispora]ORX74838.1 hypothetical protein DL89DRAFT_264624 [Linderina pennispora]